MALLDFLNRKKEEAPGVAPVLPADIYREGTLDLADAIAPAALKVGAREIELGEKFSRSFYTIAYPRFLSDGWFMPIVNLDRVLDVGIFVHPLETGEVLRNLQRKVAEAESQIADRESKGLVRDPMLDSAYQNIEELRDQLQQAQERLFDVGLYITLYGDSKEELDKVEGEVRGILDAKLVYTKPALFQQEQGFRSTLPLALDELAVNTKLNSSPLSSVFPFVSFDLTSDRGILYGINRHNASLILFDRFSLENYNSVVFAKSGSGKS
jgi:conjugal transfer ATP-binding protein TraC